MVINCTKHATTPASNPRSTNTGTTKTGIPKPPAPCTLTSCDPVTNTEQNSGRQTKIITSQPETRLAVPLGGGSGGTNTNGCGAIFDTGTGATTCIAPTYGGNANNSILTQTGSIALPNSTVGGLNGSPTLNSADWTKLIAAAIAAAAAAGQVLASQTQGERGQESSPILDPAEVAGKTPEEIAAIAAGLGLVPKGPDPSHGKGSYVDPVTGKQRILVHSDPNSGDPHVHVNDPQGNRLDINGNSTDRESPGAHLPLGG